jgi:D-xylose transport system substrate-binding protein
MKYIYKKGFSFALVVIALVVIMFIGFFVFLKIDKNIMTVNDSQKDDILIGFSITTLQEARWEIDKTEFLKKAKELGVVVDFQVAQNKVENQISQIENMIVNKDDIIVVVPYKADSLTEVIEKAHKAGIKVISYDRLVKDADTDLYVSFDNEKVGEDQAQYIINVVKDKIEQGKKLKVAYVGGSPDDNNSILLKKGSFKVLQPFIDNNKIEIVFDQFTTDWNPDYAYKNIKDYFSKNKNNQLDAVVAANDGTAFGVITALKEIGLEGKVPVSGQDAEVAALQRIIAGTQTLTVYKPISKLASSAVDLAVKMVKGLPINTNNITNDGKFNIPSVLLDPIVVTKDNIETTIIKDGFHTREEIYK